MTTAQLQALHSRDHQDEISLLDLAHLLWQQRTTLAITALLVVAATAAYAFFTTPVYEVQSTLRPPHIKDLDAINTSGVYGLSPAESLRRVGAVLESYEARLEFFRSRPELFEPLRRPGHTLEQTFERFNGKAFRILQPDPDRSQNLSSYVGIQLSYPKGLDGVTIVNDLVQHALMRERQVIAEDVRTLVNNQLNSLERRITAARAAYDAEKQSRIAKLTEADALRRAQLEDELAALRDDLQRRRQNRIQQLDEAIAIAEALNIVKPTTPSRMGGEAVQTGQGNVIHTEVSSRQIPLYFMGTESLRAEREALTHRSTDDFIEPRISEIAKELKLLEHNRQVEILQQRQNEDLFLAEIADWRKEEARLRALDLDLEAVQLVNIDRTASAPLFPTSPNKKLLLALGLVLGLMTGLMAALLRAAVIKYRALNQAPEPA